MELVENARVLQGAAMISWRRPRSEHLLDLCFEHLRETCASTGRRETTSSGKLRLERQDKGEAARGADERSAMDNQRWCVGINWASDQHAFCVIDAEGRVRGTRQVAHTATAIHDALEWVRELCGVPAAAIAIGIELRAGPLVETCLDAGFPVFAINPKQQDRFRGRFAAADAKDDPGDARVIADALRTDRRAFRRVVPDAPAIVHLRDLTRLREDLETDRTRLTNRLREQLLRDDAPWLAFNPRPTRPGCGRCCTRCRIPTAGPPRPRAAWPACCGATAFADSAPPTW